MNDLVRETNVRKRIEEQQKLRSLERPNYQMWDGMLSDISSLAMPTSRIPTSYMAYGASLIRRGR
jgi:hypothetical protein